MFKMKISIQTNNHGTKKMLQLRKSAFLEKWV